MKTKQTVVIAFLLSLGLSFTASAQGDHHGGDSVRILPDGSKVIVDPLVIEQNKVIRMDPNFEHYFDWARRLLSDYSGCTGAGDTFEPVLLKFSQYHFVNQAEMPQDSECADEKFDSIPQSQQQVVACTIKDDSYFLKEVFNQLSLAEQVSLIVHERLHALVSHKSHRIKKDPLLHLNIYSVAGGLEVALNKLYQQQHDGNRENLTVKESQALSALGAGLRGLGESCFAVSNWDLKIWNHGGGLINQQAVDSADSATYHVDDSAFIGIGSVLVGTNILIVKPNASLMHSSFIGKDVFIGDSAKINYSRFRTYTISDGFHNIRIDGVAQIDSSNLNSLHDIVLQKNVQMDHVSIQYTDINFRNGCNEYFLKEVGGNITIHPNAILKDVAFNLKGNYNQDIYQGCYSINFQYYYLFDMDLSIGADSKLIDILLPAPLPFRVSNTPFVNFGLYDEAIKQQPAPVAIVFKDKTVIDRSEDPFQGCANEEGHLSHWRTEIGSDEELQKNLCGN